MKKVLSSLLSLLSLVSLLSFPAAASEATEARPAGESFPAALHRPARGRSRVAELPRSLPRHPRQDERERAYQVPLRPPVAVGAARVPADVHGPGRAGPQPSLGRPAARHQDGPPGARPQGPGRGRVRRPRAAGAEGPRLL